MCRFCLLKHFPERESKTDGSYEIKIYIHNFYVEFNGIISFQKEGYHSKGIRWWNPSLPHGLKQSTFTIQLPIEIVPENEKDTSQCGEGTANGLSIVAKEVIQWDKENCNFNIKRYPCPGAKRGSAKQAFAPVLEKKMTLYNIFFETDKSRLLPNSFDELNKLADYLSKNKSTIIEISGHTDNTGAEEKNKKLSEARAKAVADYLVLKGIEKARISSKGYGSTMPIAKNDTEAGREQNRRVEFIIKNK